MTLFGRVLAAHVAETTLHAGDRYGLRRAFAWGRGHTWFALLLLAIYLLTR